LRHGLKYRRLHAATQREIERAEEKDGSGEGTRQLPGFDACVCGFAAVK
jgi:hypothetical protein